MKSPIALIMNESRSNSLVIQFGYGMRVLYFRHKNSVYVLGTCGRSLLCAKDGESVLDGEMDVVILLGKAVVTEHARMRMEY